MPTNLSSSNVLNFNTAMEHHFAPAGALPFLNLDTMSSMFPLVAGRPDPSWRQFSSSKTPPKGAMLLQIAPRSSE